MGVIYILTLSALTYLCLAGADGEVNSTCDTDIFEFTQAWSYDILFTNDNFTSVGDYVRLPGGYADGYWCEKTEECTLVADDNLRVKEPHSTKTCIYNNFLEAVDQSCDRDNDINCVRQFTATTFFSTGCAIFHATSDFNDAGSWDVVGETLQISCLITRYYETGFLVGGDPEVFSFLCNQSDIAMDKMREYDLDWVNNIYNTYDREIYYSELILAVANEIGILPLVTILFNAVDMPIPQSTMRLDFSSLSFYRATIARARVLESLTRFAIALLFFQEDYFFECDNADDARHDYWHVMTEQALMGMFGALRS